MATRNNRLVLGVVFSVFIFIVYFGSGLLGTVEPVKSGEIPETPPAEAIVVPPPATPKKAVKAPVQEEDDIACRRLSKHLRNEGCLCKPDPRNPTCVCTDKATGDKTYPMQALSFDEFINTKLPKRTLAWDMLFVYEHVCDHYCSSKPDVGCTLKKNKMNAIKPYDLIYVDTGYVLTFIRDWLPLINVPVHIISTGKAWNLNPDVTSFQFRLLNSSRVIRWFGSNANYTHEKVHFVPVGLHKRTRDTIAIAMDQRGTVPATKLAYLNFNADMSFRCPFTDRFIARHNWTQPTSEYYWKWPGHCFRRFVEYLMEINKVAKKAATVPPDKYYIDFLSHKMIISPPGVGVDAFRTWESLSMGRVPVVSRMPLSKELYETGGGRVPVIQVNDWTTVTPAFLEAEYAKLKAGGPYNPAPLYQLTWGIHVWKECVKSSMRHKKAEKVK